MEVGGEKTRRIMFVGESPSYIEDQRGQHFVDDSGELLRDVCLQYGLDIEDAMLTNAICCMPKKKVEAFMVSACRPSLLKAIKKYKPHVIIPLGHAPLESLMYGLWAKSLGTVERWAGWKIPVSKYNAWVCPTYAPWHVLKNEKDPVLKLVWEKHLREAIGMENKRLEYYDLGDLENQVEIVTNTKEAEKRLWDLSKRKGYLAWDYETTGLKPDREKQKIVSVSFCLDGEETWACMMKPELHKALSAVLKSKHTRKVASNLKFEERWTIAKLGHGVRNWHWDTMLAAHTLDNRPSICSVKFQAFVLLGIADFDSHVSPYLKSSGCNSMNKIMELDEKDLLLYNGLDSLLEYLVMLEQKEIMFG